MLRRLTTAFLRLSKAKEWYYHTALPQLLLFVFLAFFQFERLFLDTSDFVSVLYSISLLFLHLSFLPVSLDSPSTIFACFILDELPSAHFYWHSTSIFLVTLGLRARRLCAHHRPEPFPQRILRPHSPALGRPQQGTMWMMHVGGVVTDIRLCSGGVDSGLVHCCVWRSNDK